MYYEAPGDVTPPFTTISLDGVLGEAGWFTSNVTVTLSATDDYQIGTTEYSFDNTTWIPYSTPFNISDEGHLTIYYKSTDQTGNEETPKAVVADIDKTPPTGIVLVNDDDAYTTSETITLNLTSADATSGVHQVRVSNDGVWDTEEWEPLASTKDWTLTTGDGQKTVYVQYVDEAGWTSTSSSDTIILDTTAPAVIITSPGFGYEIKTSTVRITWTCSDESSGTSYCEIKLDDDSWINVGADTVYTFSEVGDGTHTVDVKAYDRAGLSRADSVEFLVNTSYLVGLGYLEIVAIGAVIAIAAIAVVVYLLKSRK